MAAQAARGELTCGQQVSYQNSINSMAEQWQPEIDYSSVLCDQTTALSSVSSADPNYGYPSQAEQQALSVLKNYPDSVLANWFELSRNGSLNAFDTSRSPSLQFDHIPRSIRKFNEEFERSADMVMDYDPKTSPWVAPSEQIYGPQSLHCPSFVLSDAQPPSLSTSPGGSDFFSAQASVASLASVPQVDSPNPFHNTPILIAPHLTTSSGEETYVASTKFSERSLNTRTGSCRLSPSPTSHQSRSPSVSYFCTFCDSSSTFRSKHEWKRHERSHVPQVEYTCLPQGAVISLRGRIVCAICGVSNPRAGHMNEHKMHLCIYKPAQDRTFSRKDKFAKHLKVHGLSLESPQVKGWTRLLPERALGCGFCVKYFDSFEDRFQHVAAHFEQGCPKSSWSRSIVLLSLLTQPFVNPEWKSLQDNVTDLATSISWPESSSTDSLQRRLEDGMVDGPNLAIAAYNLSSLCSGEAKPIGSEKCIEKSAKPAYAMNNSAGHSDPNESGMLQR